LRDTTLQQTPPRQQTSNLKGDRMCPVCIATATVTWIAAGATSTGGLSALVIGKLRSKPQQPTTRNPIPHQGEKHGQ
jgi:hypothetical protein